MNRSLRVKVIMFMAILLIAAMFVVGTFLVNGVRSFYVNSFFDQMAEAFTQDYISQLHENAQQGPERLKEILMSSASLGVDITTRNVYVLSTDGRILAGSDDSGDVKITKNILTAMDGQIGQKKSNIASGMDVAVPVGEYIVYVLDSGETQHRLSGEVLLIILEGLALGVCISVILSIMLSDILINPIENLRYGAERIADGDFSQRLEVESRDEIGVLTNTFNNMADVLQQTLDEIESEKDKLSTLFLHMTDGVLAFSRSGVLIHSNPSAAVMLGLEDEEAATYDGLFGDKVSLAQALALKRPDYIETELKAAQRDLELFFAPFSEEEKGGGVLVVIHDVTQQRKAEETRREFVANVSHELRTPLTNVKSYAETIMDSPDLPDEMREKFLGVIISETDRMSHIVQDLLTLSRFDNGRADMKFEYFDFLGAVRNIYEAVIMDVKRREQSIQLDTALDIPRVWGDRRRVEQVIMNLVSNAIKYTPDGGSIRLNVWAEEKNVFLKVEDNGIGIPAKDIPRLFERFYRVDKARSRESGGTGLGLSIADEIIKQHGGRILVDSEPGVGTRMTVVLPIGRQSK